MFVPMIVGVRAVAMSVMVMMVLFFIQQAHMIAEATYSSHSKHSEEINK